MKTIEETVYFSFIEAALWSTTDDQGVSLDAKYSAQDLSAESRSKITGWVRAFLGEAEALVGAYECNRGVGEYSKWEQVGHDLWLTAAGHGAGFWDGDWPEEIGDQLTQLAKKHVPEHGVAFDFYEDQYGELCIG